MSFEELPITWFAIFCCAEIIVHWSCCVYYVNTSTLKNVMNTIQHTLLKNCLFDISFIQKIAESLSYSLSIALAQRMDW